MIDVNKILTAVLAGDQPGARRDPREAAGVPDRLGRAFEPGRSPPGSVTPGLETPGVGGADQPASFLGGRSGGAGGGGLGDLLGGSGGGVLGGTLAGGLAGVLLGSKHARKYAGTALKIGAAAVIGGLAYKAYQNYRAGRPVLPQGVTDAIREMLPQSEGGPARDAPRETAGAGGFGGAGLTGAEVADPSALLLLRAMIGAAMADGRIDEVERGRLIDKVEGSALSTEERTMLEALIARPDTPGSLAADAGSPEEAAKVYLAAYLAIDADTAIERAWLDDLAARLGLDPALRRNLETLGDGRTDP
ncbi:putative membrane protein [Rhodovulum sp. PH10]|uniref:tellurite resistance TerB family protein n=1 Tax=Rhodovulum sp. PH10 TaxID=1187851 RepID=UPI00027C24F2|nr:tellurite resistance TerB family protein [Rhodovulum sp. PH10]EJW12295.1 putative membrane protein [Rhodovulum sp. PH10]